MEVVVVAKTRYALVTVSVVLSRDSSKRIYDRITYERYCIFVGFLLGLVFSSHFS